MMARHEYREENLLPGAQGAAVLRYKAVIEDIKDLKARGFGGPMFTITFINPGGGDQRFRELFEHLCRDYGRSTRERLRLQARMTPANSDRRLWAAHVLWQHDPPDFRWIAGWLVQRSGRTEDEIAKHVIWKGRAGFSETVAGDVLTGRFNAYEHFYGRVDLLISHDAAKGRGKVAVNEYAAQHAMTDETFVFESAYTRGRGWESSTETIQ